LHEERWDPPEPELREPPRERPEERWDPPEPEFREPPRERPEQRSEPVESPRSADGDGAAPSADRTGS
jgi:hypothetical protein